MLRSFIYVGSHTIRACGSLRSLRALCTVCAIRACWTCISGVSLRPLLALSYYTCIDIAYKPVLCGLVNMGGYTIRSSRALLALCSGSTVGSCWSCLSGVSLRSLRSLSPGLASGDIEREAEHLGCVLSRGDNRNCRTVGGIKHIDDSCRITESCRRSCRPLKWNSL